MSKAIPSVPAWTAADLRRLVSADRFEPYLTDAAGSPEAAASLYAWSGRVAGAVYEELGMAEIVLRKRPGLPALPLSPSPAARQRPVVG